MSDKNKHRMRVSHGVYEAELHRLQIEFVNMQQRITATGARVVVFFGVVLMDRLWPNRARVEHVMRWTIESDDKRATRLKTISHLLPQVPYESTGPASVTIPDRPTADDYDRPSQKLYRYVLDHARGFDSRKAS